MNKINIKKWVITTISMLAFAACDTDVEHCIPNVDAPEYYSAIPANMATLPIGDTTILVNYNKYIGFASANASQITLTGGVVNSASVMGVDSVLTIKATILGTASTCVLTIPDGVVVGPNKTSVSGVSLTYQVGVADPIESVPVNASATETTKNVYKYLYDNYKTNILSAVMADVAWNTTNAEQVNTWTGKYPAINGYDYIHLPYSADGSWINYSDISPVQNWWNAGGLVAIGWHWLVPTKEPNEAKESAETIQVYGNPVAMLSDWSSSIQLPASLFVNANENDIVTVKTSNVISAQGSFKNGSWNAFTTDQFNESNYNANSSDYFDITGDFSLILTSDILSSVKTGGLIISGHDYTVTSIMLGETAIWPNMKISSWSDNIQIASSKFTDVQEGQMIHVVIKDVEDGAQAGLKENADEWPAIAEGTDYFNITGDFYWPITESILTKLQTNGLIINGNGGFSISAVYVEPSVEIWSGSTAVGAWGSIEVEADKFASVIEGQYIKVTTSDVSTNAQGSLKTKESGWPAIADGLEYFNITGDFEMKVTSDILVKLQSTGLIVSGQNYTITKVSIESESTASLSEIEYTYEPDKTTFNASNALVDGTWENNVVKTDLAKVASLLKLLQEQNIVVLWRPLHEASGQWFWWGKDAESHKALWIYMFDYFAQEGVNNLIWVWTTQGNDATWYPGNEYVDIIGRDLYGNDASDCASAYNTSAAAYANKIVTLSECGYSEYTNGRVANISEQWTAGATWSWFMPWYDNTGASNLHATQTWWQDAMSQENVIDRASLPSFE